LPQGYLVGWILKPALSLFQDISSTKAFPGSSVFLFFIRHGHNDITVTATMALSGRLFMIQTIRH
jgi:hypothetical protein